MDKAADGRRTDRHVLGQLVHDTLSDMHRWGGPEGLRVIKAYVPTYESVGVFYRDPSEGQWQRRPATAGSGGASVVDMSASWRRPSTAHSSRLGL